MRPYYAKAGYERRPVGLAIVLRAYSVRQRFSLSHTGALEALYVPTRLKRLAGVNLGVAPKPDDTTISRFHRLLEKPYLCCMMLEVVNIHLEPRGIWITAHSSLC